MEKWTDARYDRQFVGMSFATVARHTSLVPCTAWWIVVDNASKALYNTLLPSFLSLRGTAVDALPPHESVASIHKSPCSLMLYRFLAKFNVLSPTSAGEERRRPFAGVPTREVDFSFLHLPNPTQVPRDLELAQKTTEVWHNAASTCYSQDTCCTRDEDLSNPERESQGPWF